jgi:CheY-like chemotaxis protein
VTDAASESPLILVVDDDLAVRTVVAKRLEIAGFRTALAANGREALDQVEALHPAVIVLDLMMPVMSGWEVVGHLRASQAHADLGILILSAIRDRDGEWGDAPFGADEFIPKPYQFAEVLRKIQGLIEAKGRG